ncbi:MAG: glycosyltransferase family 4 protein [Ignavibacteria bacterium]|nr:glycosyltransferase family 4 protein [Ignavibacteria bacterium]
MNKKLKYDVCMMTSYHPYDDDRIFYKELKSLVNKGYSVVLLAPAEKDEFELDGIKVLGFKRRRNLGRFITVFQMARTALKIKAKVYHFHEPELLVAALFLRIFLKCKLIYDVHEEHATSIPMKIKSRFVKNLVGTFIFLIERMFSRIVDHIIVVREDLIPRFTSYGCKNVSIVMVCPSKEQFKDYKKRKEIMSGVITIVHEGNLDIKTRGLDKYLYAAREVIQKYPDINFVTIGRAPKEDIEWMKSFIKVNKLEKNFTFTGWVDFNRIPDYLFNSDIGILLLQPVSKNNMMGIPNKLFDYMAAGIPVVACNFPNIAKIIGECNCGFLIDSSSYSEIAEAILKLIENKNHAKILGQNGRKCFETIYNWENMESKLISVYNNTLE